MNELAQNPDFLKELFSATIGVIITGIVGLIVGVYIERFKNRVSILSKYITSQPVAYSSKHEYWGHISVYHNGREIKNLNLFTIEIRNESSRDVSDIVMDITADNQSIIVASNGFIEDANRTLLLTTEYYNYFQDVQKRSKEEQSTPGFTEYSNTIQSEFDYLNKLKQYYIPVLNRKQTAVFNLLVESRESQSSQVDAFINMKSVDLLTYEDESIRDKRTLKYTLIYGVVIFGLGFWMLYKSFPDSSLALVLCGTLALTYSVFGLIIHHTIRALKRWFTQ